MSEPVPPRRPLPRRPLPPSLPDVISRLVEPLAEQPTDPLRRIALAWGEICGAPLARHIEPLELIAGVLHVGARGAQWRDAVFHRRGVLLERVRRYAPQVERIWLHTLADPAPTASPAPAPAALTPRTEGIGDPALRQAMERLLAARDRARQAPDADG